MLTAQLIEEVIYGEDFDASLRYGLKLKKSCAEMMELEKISSQVEAIDEAAGLEEPVAGTESADKDKEEQEEDKEAVAAASDARSKFMDSVLESLLDKPMSSSEVDPEIMEEFEAYQKRSKTLAESLILTPDPKLPSQAASTIRAAVQKLQEGKKAVIFYNLACSGVDVFCTLNRPFGG